MLMRCNSDDLKQKSLLSKYTQLQLASLRVVNAYRSRFYSIFFILFRYYFNLSNVTALKISLYVAAWSGHPDLSGFLNKPPLK